MRAHRLGALGAAAGLLALVVTGCAPEQPAPVSSTAAPSHSAPRPTPSGGSSSASPVETGCSPTDETTPAGAVTRQTIDVDGDGRADTEWIAPGESSGVRFGVTTASGATFSYSVDTGSPVAPAGFVVTLNGAQSISLLSVGREAFEHVITDCGFVQPTNLQGQPYTFDLENLRGHGTGVGCVDNSLVGFQATPTGNDRYTVRRTVIELSENGDAARNGETTTVGTGLSADDPRVVMAQSVTCGEATVSSSGVTLEG
ncbi:hypothetical protein SAMN04489806_1040 [Paramicrobacterium humi]|uniref:Uncharacterized protein n=1 Tax=Paramicrobacterium humi TaxID=640635 RepID=A0A1H4K6T6_9MICO|nr:hypothetical protein [Microbacterium humi]SEB54240.1 hypothetical protein SAMN04489806_1040 [Microbacterium humi]